MRLEGHTVTLPVVLREERDLAVLLDAGDRLRGAHGALALEDDALVDHEARGEDVAEDLAGRADLEPLTGGDVARDLAVNDDRGAVDLRIDDGGLADGERVLRADLALHMSLDADGALEGELAADTAPLAEERGRRGRVVAVGSLALGHLHLPGRRVARRSSGLGTRSLGSIASLTVLAE